MVLAGLTGTAGLAASSGATGPLAAPALAGTAQAADEDVEPLRVTIDALTPGELPRSGPLEVSGSVTNVDDDTWTTINLYPFLGSTPLTTPAELSLARETDVLDFVGERVTDPGPYAVIDTLEPGESVGYSFTVARSRLEVDERGVYWFGVHALGQGVDGRDPNADGRARTFLPYVGAEDRSLPVSVVVPLRRRVLHDADGRVAGLESWAEALAPGGSLADLVAFGAGAEGRSLTWLVDPAVTDAAGRLAAGNPARSTTPTIDPRDPGAPDADDTSAPGSPDDTATGDPGDASPSTDDPTSGGSEGTDPAPGPTEQDTGTVPPRLEDPDELAGLDPQARALALSAADWLDALQDAVGSGSQVLALPYGDLDVAAAARFAPEVYRSARRRSGSELEGIELSTQPALASPLGFLPVEALDMVREDETILLTDRMLGGQRADDPLPAVASVLGRTVVLTSSGAVDGGPGPGPRLSSLGLRQRILSEAAVRLLDTGRRSPLVVTLPLGWAPDTDPAAFFDALATDWVDLDTVAEATADRRARPVEAAELTYPRGQLDAELGPADLTAVSELVEVGQNLQDLLTFNDRIASVVSAEAYPTASYLTRPIRAAALRSAQAAEEVIREQLGAVEVTAPPGVTLSSASGRLPATITNGLDESVTVRLDARSDQPMTLRVPDSIEIPAGGSTTVLLNATTEQQGVHNVTLVLTDVNDVPLGSIDVVPIRAAQVSGVIWLIMGSGAVLLFGAIAVRLVRRVRAARAEQHPHPDDQPEDQPADEPEDRA
ncbi:hypothetical protein I601_1255 [Nocardioides dokdonensis FR1436]|uniref:Uncharacterized protein n=1 Tax=Nocardioides dokdonensis FR1436 TaxID=1300347 RepID=A0A1A9GHC5_9ACTN|nr:hypothetical protein I601_1255 [Nocardioides dokdonensis FR1436]